MKKNCSLKRAKKRFVAVRLEWNEYETLKEQAKLNHRTISGEIRARIAAISAVAA